MKKSNVKNVELVAISNLIQNMSPEEKKKVLAEMGIKFESVIYPKFGTWTSERSGKKFATVQFSSSGKGIMLNIEQINLLSDNWDKLIEYVEANDID